MSIPEAFIAELKENLRIDDVIGSYVALRRRGSNLVGLCPFHSEKTPSFSVQPERGFFHCFGCGAGGDAITFIRRIENLEYPDAVRFLADRAGMIVPEEDAVSARAAQRRLRIYEVNRAAARFFYTTLYAPEGAAGLEYLHRRGLTDATIRHFGLGFSPDSWDALYKHLLSHGFTEYECDDARVTAVTKRGGRVDMFRNRAMFPILDTRGNVIAFGARAMGDAQPKYLNTADTPVFHKSRNLFALNFAKNAAGKPLILAEGYMDVIAIHAAGFPNCVATLGTALTSEQARILRNYTDEVILSYDSDEPGQKATRRAAELLGEAGLRVRVLRMEGAKDPDEYIQKFGATRFGNLVADSAGAIEYQLARLSEGRDLADADVKRAYIRDAVDVIARLADGLDREIFAVRAADAAGLEKATVLAAVDAQRSRLFKQRKRADERALVSVSERRAHPENPDRAAFPKAARAEDDLVRLLFFHPDHAAVFARELPPGAFVTGFNRRLYEYLLPRLSANADPASLGFDAEFADTAEMDAIAALFADKTADKWDPVLFRELIGTLRDEADAARMTDAAVREMSPEDIRRMIARKKPDPPQN